MFDTHLISGHAPVGVGLPIRAAHGCVVQGAGEVRTLVPPLIGAAMLEASVVAGKRHPNRGALGRRVVLAALTRAEGRFARTLTLTFDVLK